MTFSASYICALWLSQPQLLGCYSCAVNAQCDYTYIIKIFSTVHAAVSYIFKVDLFFAPCI